ncbi:hypothetical protein [Stigmatella erecta]|uniref:Delta-60 repeat domain-containing protein n=1 Tax=Stigmatella erecta TaxID=83460 RepID=A0A1I0JWJ8_9BACT|nr:hypothetical protein [Stigmatella erecta]SEU15278.1 delta-60 repeat domain-containing protein [Stigmatella erecta]
MSRALHQQWLVLLGLVWGLWACGGDEPKPDGLRVNPTHQAVSIAPGGVVPVPVKLERSGTLSGAILVTGSAGPTGVAVESLVLTAEESEGEILLHASELASVGARGRVLLLAQSGSEAYSASLDVEVIAPWSMVAEPLPAQVTQSQPVRVKVSLTRAGGFTGPVELSAQEVPAGFEVEHRELTLAAEATSADFTFRTSYLAKSALLTFVAVKGPFSSSVSTSVDILRPPGIWDPSFGTDGVLQFPMDHQIHSVAGLPDGRFVLAVTAGGSAPVIHIRQFQIDGSPDRAFGQEGAVELATPFAMREDSSPQVALQADGRLLVLAASSLQWVLYRLLPDGRLDTSFGGTGWVSSETSRPLGAVRMAVLPGGIPLLVIHQVGVLECLRLNAKGELDASYGTSGRTLLPISNVQLDAPLGFFVDAQGRAMVATHSSKDSGGQAGLQVFRLTQAGEADVTFGPGGLRTYGVNPDFFLDGISRLGDGFVAIGHVPKTDTASSAYWIIRLADQSGTLEVQWVNNRNPVSNVYLHGSITGLSDGRILASTNDGFIRLLPDGSVDPSFVKTPAGGMHLFVGMGDAVYGVFYYKLQRLLPPL